MGRHRSPEPPEVPEQWQHFGWWALFGWVLVGVACVMIGFFCCVGVLLGG